jgi:hypothetical protein
MAILKPYATTGIGTLPHRDAAVAVSLALSSVDIPFWPQLSALSFRESMVPQYSEGMPSLRIDPEAERVWVDRDEEEIARFYETCAAPGARIAISEEYARGLHAFLRLVRGRRFPVLKGHITGPLTYTLGLADASGKPIYYDEELREISLMLLAAKARWQVDMLKEHADEVIIFIDEPILSALGGTTYMGVGGDETLRLLAETVAAIREAGGIAGIHCCGRADWPLVLASGVDILNFDAYAYGETLALYPGEVTEFLQGGRTLAWGVVPTTEDVNKEDEDSLLAIFRARMARLAERVPEDLLRSQILLTPACGAGSRTVAEAGRIFQLLLRLQEAVAA